METFEEQTERTGVALEFAEDAPEFLHSGMEEGHEHGHEHGWHGEEEREAEPTSTDDPVRLYLREMGSVEFASKLVTECELATSPGDGFGFGGEGYVRFALIENEQRIGQGVRNLRRALTKLG